MSQRQTTLVSMDWAGLDLLIASARAPLSRAGDWSRPFADAKRALTLGGRSTPRRSAIAP